MPNLSPPDLDDFDDRPGMPRPGVTHAVVDIPRLAPVDSDPVLRDGETELGRPPQVPVGAVPLSDADRRRLRVAAEAEALAQLAEAEELLASDPAVVRWAGWFASPLAMAFLAGAVGVLGLFLYSQVLSILGNLASQPLAVQWAGYAGLGVLATAVLYSMLRLMLLYARLQRNRQLRLGGLEELQSRTRLRWLAAAKTDEARTRLARYVLDYPIGTPAQVAKLARLGVAAEVAGRLLAVRAELADVAGFGSSAQWFERFRSGFQGPLDEAAEARVRHWANRAMLVTAASPNSLIDGVSSLYFGFAMLSDLCVIYNLRAGRTGTAVLLGRVFFNAYLAGQLNDLEGLIEGHADHAFEQAFTTLGVGVGSGLASQFLGKVGAKATTGYLNRLLLMRLGKYSCRMLRPVAL